MSSKHNIIIAGGGHAGIEAALAASRLGVSVVLVTMDPSAIGRMSCNPAIGGLGKGQGSLPPRHSPSLLLPGGKLCRDDYADEKSPDG